MATKNAAFYSAKFNRPDTIKSHRTESAAIKAAGDYGMIFETASEKQYQIHAMTNNTMKKFEEVKTGFQHMNFKMLLTLKEEGLI